jgi:hypothetical protein
MKYDFSNVTPEQLAELFPVILREHNPVWKENYIIEKAFNEENVRKYLAVILPVMNIQCLKQSEQENS